jgi:hypothetical protein
MLLLPGSRTGCSVALQSPPTYEADPLFPAFAAALTKAKRDAADWYAYLDELFEMDRAEERMRAARYDWYG